MLPVSETKSVITSSSSSSSSSSYYLPTVNSSPLKDTLLMDKPDRAVPFYSIIQKQRQQRIENRMNKKSSRVYMSSDSSGGSTLPSSRSCGSDDRNSSAWLLSHAKTSASDIHIEDLEDEERCRTTCLADSDYDTDLEEGM